MTNEQKVANGAAWLDKNRPGWRSQINLSILDQDDYRADIIGQLYSWWDEFPEEGRLENTYSNLGFGQISPEFTALWKEQIQKKVVNSDFITAMNKLASKGRARRKAWKQGYWIRIVGCCEEWCIDETDARGTDWIWEADQNVLF